MISALAFELSRVPLWALWAIANLAAAVALLVALSDDIRTSSLLRRVAMIVALLVVAIAVGGIIAVVFAIVYVIEKRAFRALLETRPPVRRVP